MSISKILKSKTAWVVIATLAMMGSAYLGANLMVVKTQLNDIAARAEMLAERTERIEEALQLEKERVKELEAIEGKAKDNIKDYILSNYRTVPPSIAEESAEKIIQYSDEFGLPYTLVVGVMERESRFNPFAISPLKDDPGRGLMQVRYKVHGKNLGLSSRYQLHDIDTGVKAGIQVLREYLDNANGNVRKALFRYVGVVNNKSTADSYVNDIYKNMGNFTVFKSLANQEPENDSNSVPVAQQDVKTPRPPKVVNDPTKSTGYVVHTIEKADTLYDIAQKYYGNGNLWKKILDANPGVEELKLVIGNTLMIPDMYATGLIVPSDFSTNKGGKTL